MVDLLVVIPVYNEAERIERNTLAVKKYLDDRGVDFNLVLAVDRSPDRSELICVDIANKYECVHTIINNKKAGRGLAVRNAWDSCDARIYSFIDADLSVGVESLYEGFNIIKMGKAKFVVGSRYSAGSKTSRPPLRKVVSFSYNIILQKLFKNNIKDYQCGLKMISADALAPIIASSRVNSWFWDAEIIVLGLKMGYTVYQLPVKWKEAKYSKTSLRRLFHDIILHGWGILLLYKRINLLAKFGNVKNYAARPLKKE